MKIRIGLAIAFFGFAGFASARVFDFKSESFAPYFGGTFGSSSAAQSAFGNSSGTGLEFEKTVSTAASGEFGLLFSMTRFNFKLGAEYLLPRTLEGVEGNNAAGTNLFVLKSRLSAFIPMANIEYMPFRGGGVRTFVGVGYGYAMAYLDNQYTMTTAGQSAFGVGDFTESSSATGSLLQAYTGLEFIFADRVTAAIQGGYRHLAISGFYATKDANTISGTQKIGDEVKNMDGTSRAVDLSGAFVGVSFRFYL